MTPNNPRDVTMKVGNLKKEKKFSEAITLLEKSIIKWPKNIFLLSQLISLYGRSRQVNKAFAVYEEMKAQKIIPDVITYSALIAAFYNLKRYKDIVTKIKSDELPLEALPHYCEALKKLKRYDEALSLCNRVFQLTQDKSCCEYAWIVKQSIQLHHDKKKFLKEMRNPPFDEGNINYPRYICLRIFGKMYDKNEKRELREKVKEFLKKERNKNSKNDLENALNILGS